jgi:hypothetical protein
MHSVGKIHSSSVLKHLVLIITIKLSCNEDILAFPLHRHFEREAKSQFDPLYISDNKVISVYFSPLHQPDGAVNQYHFCIPWLIGMGETLHNLYRS